MATNEERSDCNAPPAKKPRKEPRPFDITKYSSMRIALRVLYNGASYDGLAKQDNTENTIEGQLIVALKATRLIPENGQCDFSRCARTDKGVSALRNAVAMNVRAAPIGSEPINYIRVLNKVLPQTIRVVGWCCVPSDFDARFACKYRCYRYYFASAGLDIEAMQRAASRLLGRHDFRNFCKMDIVYVHSFVRQIQRVEIAQTASLGSLVHYLHIQADAFLYHQIRCIMAILFLVGQQLESEEVVSQLLDVEAVPAKPCYNLAPAEPLVLWDCAFDESTVAWQLPPEQPYSNVSDELEQQAREVLVRSAMCMEMSKEISRQQSSRGNGCDVAHSERDRRLHHVKLLFRKREGTFHEKLAALSDSKRSRRDSNMNKKDSSALNRKRIDPQANEMECD